MISTRIKKAMRKEMTVREHLETIYQFLYEIADSLEELGVQGGTTEFEDVRIKIRR